MNDVLAPGELYERDFYGWTQQQAEILRRAGEQRVNAPPGLDWEHLAREIWELGLSIELEIYHRYVILLQHLLKWRDQHRLRGGSWRGSINEQRRKIARLLKKNPALGPRRHAEFADAYADAREAAADETGMSISAFPETCPFSIEQAEDRDFWPDAAPDS